MMMRDIEIGMRVVLRDPYPDPQLDGWDIGGMRGTVVMYDGRMAVRPERGTFSSEYRRAWWREQGITPDLLVLVKPRDIMPIRGKEKVLYPRVGRRRS